MKNKIIQILFFFIMFFVVTNKVSAGSCNYVELARLKSVASNISFTYQYEYLESIDDVKFVINIDNTKEGIVIKFNNKIYRYNGSSKLTFDNLDDGMKYTFYLYTEYTDCNNKNLLTRYVELPNYNEFYNDTICLDIPNYYMCQMWYQHDLKKSEFTNKINEYKKQVENPNNNNNNDDEYSSLVLKIFEFIFANYYYFLAASGIIILIFVAYIIYDNKKDDFDLNSN